MSQKVIELTDITKVYGMGEIAVRALDGVSLSIEDGEYVAIMGSSGSGKSTMMNILGCLDRPTSGDYLLDGVDVSILSRRTRARIRSEKIGFVFQSFNLLPRLSALKNVLLPMLYHENGSISAAEKRQQAESMLEAVGLGDRVDHRPTELSGGQQQRVAIARALINQPAIVLADEPTGNLDSRSGEEIMALLDDLHAQGVTIIMVTHDEEIARFARRVIRLVDGKIVSDEPVASVQEVAS